MGGQVHLALTVEAYGGVTVHLTKVSSGRRVCTPTDEPRQRSAAAQT